MQLSEVSFPSKTKGNILSGHLWTPSESYNKQTAPTHNLICIFVHPWGILGGSSANTAPFARKLAKQYNTKCLTFDLRGVGRSDGTPTYTCHAEIEDVIAACDFALTDLAAKQLVVIGSSAGAAIAGSMIDAMDAVVAYVGIGYTFGWASSLIFGSHFKAVLTSPKPKLFIMGDNDGFTSVKQLETRLRDVSNAETMIVGHCGHFDLENASRVDEICIRISKFVNGKIIIRE